jgi:hypothetical protein
LEELRTVNHVIADVVPESAFILVDDQQLHNLRFEGRRVLPFLEKNGVYQGPPADDETAIDELERLRRNGAGFIAFVWPAFWWLQCYSGFFTYLRAQYRCVLDTERAVVFDLRNGPSGLTGKGVLSCPER